jgi:hypothetical protein
LSNKILEYIFVVDSEFIAGIKFTRASRSASVYDERDLKFGPPFRCACRSHMNVRGCAPITCARPTTLDATRILSIWKVPVRNGCTSYRESNGISGWPAISWGRIAHVRITDTHGPQAAILHVRARQDCEIVRNRSGTECSVGGCRFDSVLAGSELRNRVVAVAVSASGSNESVLRVANFKGRSPDASSVWLLYLPADRVRRQIRGRLQRDGRRTSLAVVLIAMRGDDHVLRRGDIGRRGV